MSRAWELLALRLLAVTIIGGCLALQIDGAEQVVRTARAVAAWAALLIALAVLAVAGLVRPVVPGRRRAIAVASIGSPWARRWAGRRRPSSHFPAARAGPSWRQ